MYDLPTTITVKDKSYAIRNQGDFRMVLDCLNTLNDASISKQDRMIACIAIFLDVKKLEDILKLPDLEEIAKQIMFFINCGQEDTGKKLKFKLIDWEKDAVLLVSAINNVANKEIRAEKYIHWWTFMGYYMAIGECSLSTVVSIRYKQSTNEKLEKHERKFIEENPQYFNWDRRTAEQIEEDEYIRSIWNADN